MFADRFGSYSMAATTAGIPVLSRRKSTRRYRRLCPPPCCQTVVRPWALRPPDLLTRPVTSDRSGRWRVRSEKSDALIPRRPGEVGL